MQHLWVPGPLPGLNEIINARGAARGRGNLWAKMKQSWQDVIALHARTQGLLLFDCAHWTYLFVERSMQRDKGNVGAGAQKILEDALKEAGYIPNDGWTQVLDYRHHFIVGAPVGVHLWLGSRILEREECLENLREKAQAPAQRRIGM